MLLQTPFEACGTKYLVISTVLVIIGIIFLFVGNAGFLFDKNIKLNPKKKWMVNIWQGQFPDQNTKRDGYLRTAPVGSYPANSAVDCGEIARDVGMGRTFFLAGDIARHPVDVFLLARNAVSLS